MHGCAAKDGGNLRKACTSSPPMGHARIGED
jgi:hypothetical protein